MKTSKVIKEMLTENTGKGLLDSGFAYGRNWERNQSVNFDKRPEVWVNDFGFTIDLYHFLVGRLDYNEKMTEFFLEQCDETTPYLEEMEIFAEKFSTNNDEIRTVNTYNYDSLLSQVIQFTVFPYDESEILGEDKWGYNYGVLLQIHGGCDVRGGYTAPKFFNIQGDEEFRLYDENFTVHCSQGHVFDYRCGEWSTDDGDYVDLKWEDFEKHVVGKNRHYFACLEKDCSLPTEFYLQEF